MPCGFLFDSDQYPAYVFHTTGAMKAFLDHFAYRWLPHRPAPEMFGKRAVILTQCLGAGANEKFHFGHETWHQHM